MRLSKDTCVFIIYTFCTFLALASNSYACDSATEFECSNGQKSVCCKKNGEICSPLGSGTTPGPECISETCESLGNLSCGVNNKECCPIGWTCSIDENGNGSCNGVCKGNSFPCPDSTLCCDQSQICVEENGSHKCETPDPNPRCEGRNPPHLPCGERCCPVSTNCQPGIDAAGKTGVCCQPGWSWDAEQQRCFPPEICKAADNGEEYGCGKGTSCCSGSLSPVNCCDDASQTCCGSTGACCPKGSTCCADGSCVAAGEKCEDTPPDGR